MLRLIRSCATRLDALHPQWDVSKLMRYIKIACNALQCIFQHVGISAADFGISQPFIIRFSVYSIVLAIG